MTTYTQLTREQRYQIKVLLDTEHNQREIAYLLGVHKSSIQRELKRNRGKRGYRPKQAHEKALARRKRKSEERITEKIWALVEKKLCEDWSPEQVSGKLRMSKIFVSHERIYQYVYADKRAGGALWQHLRHPKSTVNGLVGVIAEVKSLIVEALKSVLPS